MKRTVERRGEHRNSDVINPQPDKIKILVSSVRFDLVRLNVLKERRNSTPEEFLSYTSNVKIGDHDSSVRQDPRVSPLRHLVSSYLNLRPDGSRSKLKEYHPGICLVDYYDSESKK